MSSVTARDIRKIEDRTLANMVYGKIFSLIDIIVFVAGECAATYNIPDVRGENS